MFNVLMNGQIDRNGNKYSHRLHTAQRAWESCSVERQPCPGIGPLPVNLPSKPTLSPK